LIYTMTKVMPPVLVVKLELSRYNDERLKSDID
jgi:hypothetical protein